MAGRQVQEIITSFGVEGVASLAAGAREAEDAVVGSNGRQESSYDRLREKMTAAAAAAVRAARERAVAAREAAAGDAAALAEAEARVDRADKVARKAMLDVRTAASATLSGISETQRQVLGAVDAHARELLAKGLSHVQAYEKAIAEAREAAASVGGDFDERIFATGRIQARFGDQSAAAADSARRSVELIAEAKAHADAAKAAEAQRRALAQLESQMTGVARAAADVARQQHALRALREDRMGAGIREAGAAVGGDRGGALGAHADGVALDARIRRAAGDLSSGREAVTAEAERIEATVAAMGEVLDAEGKRALLRMTEVAAALRAQLVAQEELTEAERVAIAAARGEAEAYVAGQRAMEAATRRRGATVSKVEAALRAATAAELAVERERIALGVEEVAMQRAVRRAAIAAADSRLADAAAASVAATAHRARITELRFGLAEVQAVAEGTAAAAAEAMAEAERSTDADTRSLAANAAMSDARARTRQRDALRIIASEHAIATAAREAAHDMVAGAREEATGMRAAAQAIHGAVHGTLHLFRLQDRLYSHVGREALRLTRHVVRLGWAMGRLGAHAAVLPVKLGFHVFSGAIHGAERLARAVARATANLGRLAVRAADTALRDVERWGLRGAVVGAGVSGLVNREGFKATTEDNANTLKVRDAAIDANQGLRGYQATQSLAKQFGVDGAVVTRMVEHLQQAMTKAFDPEHPDPALQDTFRRLGIRTAYRNPYSGRMQYREASDVLSDVSVAASRPTDRFGRRLDAADTMQVLEQLLGNRADIMKASPVINAFADRGQGAYAGAEERERRLGTYVSPQDVRAASEYRAATTNLRDSLAGLRHEIARGLTPTFTRLSMVMTDLFVGQRQTWAKAITDHVNATVTNLAWAAKILEHETGIVGRLQHFLTHQTTEGQRIPTVVWIYAEYLVHVQRRLQAVVRMAKRVGTAMRDWAVEHDLTSMETWKRVLGDIEEVALRVGNAIGGWAERHDLTTLDGVERQFHRLGQAARTGVGEAVKWSKLLWRAIGKGEDVGQDHGRLEKLAAWRNQVVAYVRAAYADVRKVIAGSDRDRDGKDQLSTVVGGIARRVREAVKVIPGIVKDLIGKVKGYAAQAKKVWAEFQKVWSGGKSTEYPWINTLVEGFRTIRDRVEGAWDMFKKLYEQVSAVFKYFGLDLGTTVMFLGIARATGLLALLSGGFGILVGTTRKFWGALKLIAAIFEGGAFTGGITKLLAAMGLASGGGVAAITEAGTAAAAVGAAGAGAGVAGMGAAGAGAAAAAEGVGAGALGAGAAGAAGAGSWAYRMGMLSARGLAGVGGAAGLGAGMIGVGMAGESARLFLEAQKAHRESSAMDDDNARNRVNGRYQDEADSKGRALELLRQAAGMSTFSWGTTQADHDRYRTDVAKNLDVLVKANPRALAEAMAAKNIDSSGVEGRGKPTNNLTVNLNGKVQFTGAIPHGTNSMELELLSNDRDMGGGRF